MTKRVFSTCVSVILLASSCVMTTIHAQTAVGTEQDDSAAGYSMAFVVMDNGDVYRSDYAGGADLGYPQGAWQLCCNVFSAGGPVDRVVGLGGGIVLTAGGGTYRIGTGAGRPCFGIYDGSIAIPAGQSFVAIGSRLGLNGRHIYAVTDAGFVYRAGGGGWEYAGALPAAPTLAGQRTWGTLKVLYR